MYSYLFITPTISQVYRFRAANPEDAERMARQVKGVRPGVRYQLILSTL